MTRKILLGYSKSMFFFSTPIDSTVVVATLTELEMVPVTWDQIVDWCQKVAQQARNGGFQSILAISRGGLVPARVISTFLGDLPIWCITAHRYDRTQCGTLVITGEEVIDHLVPPVLVVDEICDAGDTIEAIGDLLDKRGVDHQLAVLLQKGKSTRKILSIFCAEIVDVDPEGPEHWFCFPWDKEYFDRFAEKTD
ncbi:MAG TPA: phosphoribosyltransferase family protein [Candidatus Lokiarchaeia archaeon]|nr:phosphoribosyltransferase family protein [Candidatus Lokiarchaeia archaeon]